MATLLLFCKRPQRGFGKQRLAAEIGVDLAFKANELLLNCALEDMAEWDGPKIISPSDEDSREWAQKLLNSFSIKDGSVICQGSGDMAKRIERLDAQIRANGESIIVIIGSDCPAMKPHNFREALALLETKSIVYTPARDGGATLMANKTPWIRLSELHWSKDSFAESLKNIAKEESITIGSTSESFDIDTKEDLIFFYEQCKGDLRLTRVALQNWICSNIL
jgi:glycosyltransferase A (GT-A) superfamily protein (DUF2064 family)